MSETIFSDISQDIQETTQEGQVIENTTDQESSNTTPEIENQEPPFDIDSWKPNQEDLEEHIRLQEDELAFLKTYAKDKGLDADKLEVLAHHQSMQKQAWEQQIAQQTESLKAELKQEWGAQYEQNLQGALAMVKRFGGDELVRLVSETPFGEQKEVIKFLVNLKQNISKPDFFGGEPVSESSHNTMAEAWEAMCLKNPSLRQDIMSGYGPSYESARKTWESLAEKYRNLPT